MKKYKLTDETRQLFDRTLHRIVALRDFGNIKEGDIGGWIEKEKNLSHEGLCWIYYNSTVCDNAKVYGNVIVLENAKVGGGAKVGGDEIIRGDVEIYNKADYIVFKNWWSSGRYFTWTRSNNMWSVGCFYGTGDELIKKAYEDSEDKGKHYEEIVEYVNKCVLKSNNESKDVQI